VVIELAEWIASLDYAEAAIGVLMLAAALTPATLALWGMGFFEKERWYDDE
jgi:hypothetical protein